ncbi:MAG: DSD1 family PLP-dependent enzyme [Victivallaceae bacterium]
MRKTELDTPCLVLDIDIFERNLILMRDFALDRGKNLRPHVKTHKCSAIAKRQLATGGCAGLCVAKISEARKLIDAGINNILVTSPVVTDAKIRNLFDGLKLAPELMVVIDNRQNAETLSAAALERNNGLPLRALVDIDPEMGRTGIAYADALPLAEFINGLPGLKLEGIQCYAGLVQHINNFEERREKSLELMRKAAEVFRKMRNTGLPMKIFTGTGTGTFNIDTDIPELTDLQVGSYCLMDAEYCNIGGRNGTENFTVFKPSLSLLTSVISVNRKNFVTVDAGLKAMYFTPHAPPYVLNPTGSAWRYEWFGDEQGKVFFGHEDIKPYLGDVIELSASHCDPTINLYDSIWVVRENEVIDKWEIDLRGCSQ